MKGKAGLYVSIQPVSLESNIYFIDIFDVYRAQGPESEYLVWGKEKYEWYFSLQPSKAYYTLVFTSSGPSQTPNVLGDTELPCLIKISTGMEAPATMVYVLL